MGKTSLPPVDFPQLFHALPGCYLILLPDFTIVEVSDSYLAATNTKREEILGKGIFEVFPDNPNDPDAHGVAILTVSLTSVLQNKAPHSLPVIKYDISLSGSASGEFEERYWLPQNYPVIDASGSVVLIVHNPTDVTKAQKADQALAKKVLELEKLNALMTGRELAMVELKKENAELRKKLG